MASVGVESARVTTPDELALALEAVCFALSRPLELSEAASILGCSVAAAGAAADLLTTKLRATGLMLQRHRDEVQLVTRPEVAWAVQRALNPERATRLSRAALETLAIIAYRQPVTRAGIEAIRGVNCEAVLDSLERRELIVEVGRQDTPGQPRLFGTTMRFLQAVGLEGIEQLPPLPGGDAAAADLTSGTFADIGENQDSDRAALDDQPWEMVGESGASSIPRDADPD
jgi:segregation and condensation protein B